MDYQCLRCGTVSPKEEWERVGRFRCPHCSYRVAKKLRSPIARRVKAI